MDKNLYAVIEAALRHADYLEQLSGSYDGYANEHTTGKKLKDEAYAIRVACAELDRG
jgi:hypothetical protein